MRHITPCISDITLRVSYNYGKILFLGQKVCCLAKMLLVVLLNYESNVQILIGMLYLAICLSYHHYNIILFQFERPVVCSQDALFIGSKLDLDVNTQICRISFHGKLIKPFTEGEYRKTGLS